MRRPKVELRICCASFTKYTYSESGANREDARRPFQNTTSSIRLMLTVGGLY